MPFGRLHEEAAGDGKLLALSDAAWRMWGMGLIYCQKNLTDGFIAAHAVASFGVRAPHKKVAEELCRAQVPGKAPLWKKVAGGFQVHDYLQWNDSREIVQAKRAGARDRIERWRERHGKDVAQNAPPNALLNVDSPPLQDAHDVVRGSGSSASEKGSGEKPPRSAGVFTGALPRDHVHHAACDPTFARCVPTAVHEKLTNLLTPKYQGDRAAAAQALHAWYPTIWQGLPGEFVMGDAFKFWQGRFDRAFATKDMPTAPASTVPGVDRTRKYLEEQNRS
jgi:hypothetical protein